MSEPIKLSELVAARERMRTGDRDAALVVEEDLDTLIEIAQAAVAWRAIVMDDDDEAYDVAYNRLADALDKVRP